MALVFMDGLSQYADVADMAERWLNLNTGVLTSFSFGTQGRAGSRSLAIAASASPAMINAVGGNTGDPLYFAFDFHVAGTLNATSEPFFAVMYDGYVHWDFGDNFSESSVSSLKVGSDGSVLFMRGSVQVAASVPGVIAAGALHRVEVEVVVNATGVLKVWVDGVSVINFTGDTHSDGTAGVLRAGFDGGMPTAGVQTHHFSNIIAWDSKGAVFNAPPPLGNMLVQYLNSTDVDLDDPNGTTFKDISAAGANDYPIADVAGTPTILHARAHLKGEATGTTYRSANIRAVNGAAVTTKPIAFPPGAIKNAFVDFTVANATELNAAQVGVELTDV